MATGLLHFDDSNFEAEVLQSSQPVLVDFWAAWCGPCRALAPVVEELSKDFAGSVKVGKLDVDANPQTAMRYGIRSIPTVMVFQNGKAVEHLVGAYPKKAYADILERVRRAVA